MMNTTAAPFSITFDGREVIRPGGDMLDNVPEHAFPLTFGTQATAIINSAYPRLDSYGSLSMEFEITAVTETPSHLAAWQAFFNWLESWKTAGKGVFTWQGADGASQSFESVITEAEPKIQGAYFLVSYSFTLGKPVD